MIYIYNNINIALVISLCFSCTISDTTRGGIILTNIWEAFGYTAPGYREGGERGGEGMGGRGREGMGGREREGMGWEVREVREGSS